jgi:peptidoglycan/LPS O-acetylase OafA/YrhL
VPTIGPLAVYSFFILSGFLMTLIMHNTYGYSLIGVKKYALNRFYRLYPVYWVLLLLSLVILLIVGASFATEFHPLIVVPDSFSSALANFTMFYPSFSPNTYSIRVLPATWALTIEIVFYILIGLGVSKNKTITWLWFLLSLAYLIYQNVVLQKLGFGYGNFLSASLPFSAGALAFYYTERILALLKRFKVSLFSLLCIFSINIIIAGLSDFADENVVWKIQYLCKAINLILSILVTVKLAHTKTKGSIMKKVDKELGDLSYPVYIFHWSAAMLAAWSLNMDYRTNINVFVIGLLITICVSKAVNIGVNNRIELLRHRVKKNIISARKWS